MIANSIFTGNTALTNHTARVLRKETNLIGIRVSDQNVDKRLHLLHGAEDAKTSLCDTDADKNSVTARRLCLFCWAFPVFLLEPCERKQLFFHFKVCIFMRSQLVLYHFPWEVTIYLMTN